MDATAADLEVANSKWINLSATLREKEVEVERLQTLEKMAKQANVREDGLRTKVKGFPFPFSFIRYLYLTSIAIFFFFLVFLLTVC